MKVYSVSEVAEMIDADEREVRTWAGRHEVQRVGAAFVFTEEDVDAICEDFGVDADEDDEVEGEAEDEGDEEDGEDQDESMDDDECPPHEEASDEPLPARAADRRRVAHVQRKGPR